MDLHETSQNAVCLIDLILYVPVNNFLVITGRVFLVWTSSKQGLLCPALGHNPVPPMILVFVAVIFENW